MFYFLFIYLFFFFFFWGGGLSKQICLDFVDVPGAGVLLVSRDKAEF